MQFNPYLTTVAQGMFGATSVGMVQGTAYPDPSATWRLRGGVLSSAETLPMWGGCALFEDVPGSVGGPASPLGVIVGRANGISGSKALAGFSVFDQNASAVTSPQNTVPTVSPGGQVNMYSLGSNARIIVAADPSLVSLRGGPIGAQVSWDWVNQLLVPYTGSLTISSGTYNSTTGIVTLTMSASIGFDAGDSIVVSSLTGSGAYASLDGTFTAIAPTSGTTVTYQAATGLGAAAITGGTLTLGSGSDVAIPVKVLDIQTTNCQVVDYNAATQFATWGFNGCCAVIQI
jgi:hypothetical protein